MPDEEPKRAQRALLSAEASVTDAQTPPEAPTDRRHKATLRELLDELIAFTREVTRNARGMSEAEIEYAHQRLEWLADEVWREAIGSGGSAGR